MLGLVFDLLDGLLVGSMRGLRRRGVWRVGPSESPSLLGGFLDF
jgi:hypothetical protein